MMSSKVLIKVEMVGISGIQVVIFLSIYNSSAGYASILTDIYIKMSEVLSTCLVSPDNH